MLNIFPPGTKKPLQCGFGFYKEEVVMNERLKKQSDFLKYLGSVLELNSFSIGKAEDSLAKLKPLSRINVKVGDCSIVISGDEKEAFVYKAEADLIKRRTELEHIQKQVDVLIDSLKSINLGF